MDCITMNIDDKSDSKDNLDLKSKSTIVNRKPENNKHISGVDKTFSHRRGVLRIFMGLVALLLWIIIGGFTHNNIFIKYSRIYRCIFFFS